jgi:hypothetical protein
MEKVDLTKVLEWVNEIRANHKRKPIKRLPKGELGSSDNCTIAKALRAYHVCHNDYYFDSGPDEVYKIPQIISDFIDQFDAGNFSELIKE